MEGIRSTPPSGYRRSLSQQLRDKYQSKEPWRGVSLGGWLFLEPGPADPLFDRHPDPKTGEEMRCEWDLMEVLRATRSDKEVREVLKRHRDTHITKSDFARIKACGLNAVRLPVGYWIVTGPTHGDIYDGPALEYVDRALDWAEEFGLQVMLDLHGCPGGESGEAPCGRRQRPDGTWQWQQWRVEEALDVLEVLAKRYCNRKCVTGMAVCNEPSNQIPLTRLCQFYDQATDRIRGAGMDATSVAIVLPCFQRPEHLVYKKWQAVSGGRHVNWCFDVHCYHCFENEGHGKSYAQQLRAVQANAGMLQRYPIVIGEWSLALGVCAWATCGGMKENEVYRWFGRAQIEAFKDASHGNFFWNWTERKDQLEWNFQEAYSMGMLSGPPPQLPVWSDRGAETPSEDPLEEICHPSPLEPRVFFGEKVFIRTFYGRYLDVYGPKVYAQWADKGKWQYLTFCLPGGKKTERRALSDGDTVVLRGWNGRFLTIVNGMIAGTVEETNNSRFVLRTLRQDEHDLRHRGIVYLQSKATGRLLDADEDEEGIFNRYADTGNWQQFCVEKQVCRKFLEASPCKLQASPCQEKVSEQEKSSIIRPPAESLEITPKTKRPRLSAKLSPYPNVSPNSDASARESPNKALRSSKSWSSPQVVARASPGKSLQSLQSSKSLSSSPKAGKLSFGQHA